MNYLIRSLLCCAVMAFSMHTAIAHPAGHHHMPCDHMGDSKMMQKHMEEHHKEGAAKTPDSKEETKATAPAPATQKPAPKPSTKPVP
ncbi:MAG: hypothetical protein LW629_11730 [Burkholderiales bacterium]|nr:hypothetical protein [Burkholderiales bacterium]